MTVDLERGYKRREPCGPKQYLNLLLRSVLMIYVGIDVAKDKHDCFITNSDGEVLFQVFTIQNNREGFDGLFSRIQSVSHDMSNIKVGLEATGHYSYNLLGYLIDKCSPPSSSIRSTQIFTEKVSALERRKRIRSMPEPLL